MVIKIINRSKETFGRYVHPKARITATEKWIEKLRKRIRLLKTAKVPQNANKTTFFKSQSIIPSIEWLTATAWNDLQTIMHPIRTFTAFTGNAIQFLAIVISKFEGERWFNTRIAKARNIRITSGTLGQTIQTT
jgi:hypothetical protein